MTGIEPFLAAAAATAANATGAIATSVSLGASAVGFSTGASLAIGGFVGSIALPVGLTAGALAVSALLRPDAPPPSARQLELRQAIPSRIIHYGRVKVSGPLLFYESRADTPAGFSNKSLWKIVALSAREIDAFETHFLDNKAMTLDGSGWSTDDRYTADGTSLVRIRSHLGTDSQTYDTVLGGVFPEWTSAHRLRGIAYALVECVASGDEKLSAFYPNGEPVYAAVIRGAKVCDPRDGGQDPDDPSTWFWSDNAGLAILDWLTYAYGWGKPWSRIDTSSFEDFADLCDELVPLAAGGSEKRYRIAASVDLNNERRTDVLTRLRRTCNARIVTGPSGLIGIRGGEWRSPVVSLSLGASTTEARISDGVGALDRYNELAIRYVSPDHGYVEVEADPWRNEASIAEEGIKRQALDLLEVPSHSQARRIAKQMEAYDNPKWIGEIHTTYDGLQLLDQENCELSWPEFNEPDGEFDGDFWVEPGARVSADRNGMIVPVRSAVPESFDWDPETEEGTPPPIPAETEPDFDPGDAPAVPTGLSATGGDDEAFVSWTAPNDPVFAFAKVWRAASGAGFGMATDVSGPLYGSPNQAMAFNDSVSAGTYDYFVTAHNAAGVASSEVGPDAATVT